MNGINPLNNLKDKPEDYPSTLMMIVLFSVWLPGG